MKQNVTDCIIVVDLSLAGGPMVCAYGKYSALVSTMP